MYLFLFHNKQRENLQQFPSSYQKHPPDKDPGRYTEESRVTTGDSTASQQASYSAGGPDRRGLHLNILSHHQEERRVAPNSQSSPTQQVHPSEAIPHGNPCGSHTRITQGLVGASLDLKDAYLHVPIHSSDRRWLGFCLENLVYHFNSLPFGLSTAPRMFTRIVKMIAEHLRMKGRFVFVYLYDWLLTAPSEELQNAVKETTQLLTSLGLIINKKKSNLTPSQQITFLGTTMDFAKGSAFPTPDRVADIVSCTLYLLRREKAPASVWMRLLGLIVSLTAVLPQCLMRMRVIQLHILSQFNLRHHPITRQIRSSNTVRKALTWWTRPGNINPGRLFRLKTSSSTLTTDASKTGWGAHFKDIQLSGTWSANIARHHINILELSAIHLALKKLLPRLQNKMVTVCCDNMSVVSYINKGGGTRSRFLCLQVVKLLKWCLRHHITLHAIHLLGEDNVLADSLSRKTSGVKGPSKVRGSSVEWHLNPVVCKTVFNRIERPLIDLFAT